MTLVLNGHDMSGATAARPTNADVGQPFFDTTTNQWLVWNGTAWQSGSSLGTARVPLPSLRNANGGSLVTTSPGATDFTLTQTFGTSSYLAGHAAQNNTKTDDAILEFVLPPSYVAGTNLTLTVNGRYVVSAGTTITATVDADARVMTDSGGYGSDLNATAAIALTTTAGNKAFTITGTTLNPGDRIQIKITTSVQEAGNTGTATAQVNSVKLS